jgi:hypothetical protein
MPSVMLYKVVCAGQIPTWLRSVLRIERRTFPTEEDALPTELRRSHRLLATFTLKEK